MRPGYTTMTPETKQQSMLWKHACSQSPCKFKVQPSAGKKMRTIFRDAEGILLIDYVPQKVTITLVCYADLHRKLRDAIKEKHRKFDPYTPAHWSYVGQAAVLECNQSINQSINQSLPRPFWGISRQHDSSRHPGPEPLSMCI